MFETDPDWAPSLHMGHDKVKPTDAKRSDRAKQREMAKQQQQINTDVTEPEPSEDVVAVGEACTQTELTGSDIDSMQDELNALYEEKRNLKQKLKDNEMFTSESFESDDEKVRFYTGLPSFASLLALFTYLSPHLPQAKLLSTFQLLISVFLRLRLNLPMQHIAYLFKLHRSTVSARFKEALSVMYTQLLPLVRWPDREFLQVSMPHQFIESFGNKVAVIIDCFEIFIERPSNLQARAETWSNYKHNNTLKYMIGATPRGEISFISKGFGGRTSDREVTEESGFLNKLLPGDVVLADRGFDISDSVGMMYAEVKIPNFTKGKSQLSARDVEGTRKIAHLRIHIERVIGNLRGKYNIVHDTIPIDMVLPCEGETVTFLDKIVLVCCALTNMCPSVVLP